MVKPAVAAELLVGEWKQLVTRQKSDVSLFCKASRFPVENRMHLTECPSGSTHRVLRGIHVVPLVIPSVALILGDGRRMRYGIWLAVASGLWAIALYALEVENGRRGGAVGSEVLLSSLAVVPILLGFLFALLGSLLVARMCGFRLLRGGNLFSALPA